MAHYIETDLEGADLLLYGEKSQLNEDLVETQRSNFMSNMLPDSVAFFTTVMNLQKQMAKNRALQIAKGAFRKVRSLWNENEIRELKSIGDFQHAPDVMKRYIMAEPTIRALWLRQLCDGYNDFCDYNRDQSGEDLKEYRQVMNGMVVVDDDNDDIDHEYVIYDNPEDRMGIDDSISSDQQIEIYHTWENIRSIIAKGEEDPTSETNGWLSV